MSIDEIFQKYPENIFGFRTNDNIKIVDFWVKKDWEIPSDKLSAETQIKKQKVDEQTSDIYYILFSNTTTFIDLFNIVTNIIEYNLDKEKKQDLFKEKMNELKKMFMNGQYDDLKNLTFEINNEKLPSVQATNVES